jgi:hypothetical protein
MNPHIGSSFDDFLAEEAVLQETTAVAIKEAAKIEVALIMMAKIAAIKATKMCHA